MKKIFVLLLLAFTAITTNAQETATIGNNFTFKGKLISDVVKSPQCGIIASAIVLEFKVLDDPNNAISGKTIGIVIPCPELYGKDFFQNGEKYTLTVADKNQETFDYLIANEAALEKYNLPNKLYAVEVVIVE
jgi:hypothetical protein